MIGFFIAATVLLVGALALVVYPLLRRSGGHAAGRPGDVVALSRERLAELKRKTDDGEISQAEYDAQARDLETQLADDLHDRPAPDAEPVRRGGRWVGVTVAVCIPVLSGLLYLALGQPQALIPENRRPATTADAAGEHPADVASMVSRLAERLKKNPNDPEGWLMLGRSYMALNRYQQAAEAFKTLREQVGDRPEVLVREATARAMARGGDLSGQPTRLVARALERAPDHPHALWMAATAAYQAADYETAVEYYRRVRPVLDGEPREQVDGMLRELSEKGYGQAAADPARRADGGLALRVNVAVAPELQAEVDDTDTVFVFAKAVDGPPMPLAVVRKIAADLPLTATLDDSQAMMPQLRLSQYERVTVGARISGSGQVAAQPGDLEGGSPPVATNTSQPIEITIDRVVQ